MNSVLRFELGQLHITPGAEQLPGEAIATALRRHVTGDFGDLDEHDFAVNERAVRVGGRILSVYKHGELDFWLITEANRSRTTVLLPNEY